MGLRGKTDLLRPKLLAASVAACFALSSAPASSNPSGPTVVYGSAAFTAAGNSLTVTNSANAIINWQGFSIGINEITRFLQPSAASAVLNRVVGSGGVIPQSVIDGVLQSNGRVFLLNQSGILFGANARVDVAGLIASSLNMSDQDFLNGRLRFTEIPGAGMVKNEGLIETTSGGRVFLVAPGVENSGIIRAPQGEILLAAGKSAELVSEATPLVTVRVVADNEQALNVGTLVADAGRIGMYGALVRNSGVAEANGALVGPGGEIRFVATKDLTLDPGSRVAANGTSGGKVVLQAEGGTNLIGGTVEAAGSTGKGGEVQALGVRVGVVGHGVIDASGETGGGTVLVGGDYQGKNPDIQNAERTYVGPDGVIRADARTSGDGGRVIIWADGDTRFYGSVSARGGNQSGDGGFVEISGKHNLAFNGAVDTAAPNGRPGRLLLDPDSIWIHDGGEGAWGSDGEIADGSIIFGDGTGQFDVSQTALEAAASTTFITLQANNSITISDLVTTGVLNLANGASFSTGIGGITMQNTANTVRSTGRSFSFYANNGPVTLGNIDTSGASSTVYTSSTGVSINGSSISVASITTGNTSTSSSSVGLFANGTGGIAVGGPITTGSAFYGSSVSLYANGGGGVSVGNIVTGSSPFSGSNVYITSGAGAPGDVVTGNITTGTSGNSNVDINPSNGSISTGAISTGSAGSYSYVNLSASAGNVSVNGNIATGSSGYQSYVNIYSGTGVSVAGSIGTGDASSDSHVTISSLSGDISLGSINTGPSGYDSHVNVAATAGNIGAGNISTGTSGFCVGDCSSTNSRIDLSASGNVAVAALSTGGGTFSDATVQVSAGGDIGTGAITTGPGSSSYVDMGATGSITTGAIGTASSYDSGVYLDAGGNISTGSITTGGGGTYTYVSLDASGSITTGAIVTGDSSYDSGVYVDAGGGISIASIATGNAGLYSYVDLYSSSGSVTVGGVKTGNADGSEGQSYVNMYANSGNLSVLGAVTTGSSYDSSVYLSTGGSGGNIAVSGPIMTASAGSYSYVSLSASSGSVATGNITTGGAGYDSGIYINAYTGISTGALTTGPAGTYSYVYLYNSQSGGISTGSIATADGAEGSVGIYAYGSGGNISTGTIMTGNSATDYTYIDLYAQNGSITTGSLTTGMSSSGSYVSAYAPLGGVSTGSIATGTSWSNYVSVNAGSDITTGAITTRPAFAPYYGGSVNLNTASGRVLVNGGIDTRGVDGMAGTPYNWGTQGGQVYITRSDTSTPPPGGVAVQVNGSILTGGGNGTTSDLGYGGSGGWGGSVYISGGEGLLLGAIKVAGSIIATGGAGGAATATGWDGGAGGGGGTVNLLTMDAVTVGPVPLFGMTRTAIDVSGGMGGAGGPSANGGAGGSAGTIEIDPTSITLQGLIMAVGGAGGAAGAGGTGGAGGVGGYINLYVGEGGEPLIVISNVTAADLEGAAAAGVIRFINGPANDGFLPAVIAGGAAGAGGGAAGSDGSIFISGQILAFLTLSDPLSIPTVLQAVNNTTTGTDKATTSVSENTGTGQSSEKDNKKKTFGSCRPAA